MAICHFLTLILAVIVIVPGLRYPSSPHPPSTSSKVEFSKLSRATNVSIDDIAVIQEELGFLDPQSMVRNVVSNVTKTWSTITQQYISSSNHDQSTKSSKNMSVEDKWIKSANIINELINAAIKSSLPLMLDLAYSSDLSPKCSASLLQILSGIRSNRGWALSCKFTAVPVLDTPKEINIPLSEKVSLRTFSLNQFYFGRAFFSVLQ